MNPGKKQGFSLIEILIVIGVIAAFMIAALVAYPQVQASSRAQQERRNVSAIASSIKQAFLSKGYGNLSNDAANMARAFPPVMNNNNYSAGQAITSAWNKPVEVTVSPDTDLRFLITYRAVPDRVCEPFARYVSSVFDRVQVGDTTVKDNLHNPRVDYDPATVISACSADASADIVMETN